ncbi:MAG: apolipoprotein N-acyltransferase, partial [Planctomycetota bacterium]
MRAAESGFIDGIVSARPRLFAVACGLLHALFMLLAFDPFGLWGFALVATAPLVLGADRLGRMAPLSREGLVHAADADGRSRARSSHRRSGARPVVLGLMVTLAALPLWIYWTHWTARVSALGFIPLPIYLSLYPGLFVWLGTRFVRARPGVPAVAWAPVLWVGLEMLRGAVVFHGFPWYLIAHPMIASPELAWPALFLGTYAVSCLVAIVSTFAAQMVGVVSALAARSERGWSKGGVAWYAPLLLVLLWASGYAWFGPAPPGAGSGRSIRLGLVQTDVPQSIRGDWTPERRLEDWRAIQSLLFEAAEDGVRFVVLPEGMYPGTGLDREAVEVERESEIFWPLESGAALPTVFFYDSMMATQLSLGVPLLVGAAGREGFELEIAEDGRATESYDTRHNSVFLVENGVATQRYDKLFLTPFGEVMPYISWSDTLERAMLSLGASGMEFSYTPGDRDAPLELDGLGVATPICFEATMSGVCRRLAFEGGERRAGLLVNATNEGWFGSFDAARRHHLLAARWRCVELATPMVRSANTGLTCVIDRWGRVTAELEPRTEGVLIAEVELGAGSTTYAVIGDAFGWLMLAGVVPIAALGRGRGRVVPIAEDGDREESADADDRAHRDSG